MQGEGGVCKNGSKSYSDETAMRVRTTTRNASNTCDFMRFKVNF